MGLLMGLLMGELMGELMGLLMDLLPAAAQLPPHLHKVHLTATSSTFRLLSMQIATALGTLLMTPEGAMEARSSRG